MRKLSLDVAALEVQSFTTDAGMDAAGTVKGYDSRTTLSRQPSCLAPPCTLEDTCADTCGFTCQVDTCYDTCHTDICACNLTDGC